MTIVIRDGFHAARAKKHNRSTEAEIRANLAAVAAGEVGRGGAKRRRLEE
ncbi:hypothetical protein M8997_017680 [Phyllobacterium sp. 21LDTY02-6]|nr:hypothetical protein [Phyllobacterium sp. 21LDTY02-6]